MTWPAGAPGMQQPTAPAVPRPPDSSLFTDSESSKTPDPARAPTARARATCSTTRRAHRSRKATGYTNTTTTPPKAVQGGDHDHTGDTDNPATPTTPQPTSKPNPQPSNRPASQPTPTAYRAGYVRFDFDACTTRWFASDYF